MEMAKSYAATVIVEPPKRGSECYLMVTGPDGRKTTFVLRGGVARGLRDLHKSDRE